MLHSSISYVSCLNVLAGVIWSTRVFCAKFSDDAADIDSHIDTNLFSVAVNGLCHCDSRYALCMSIPIHGTP